MGNGLGHVPDQSVNVAALAQSFIHSQGNGCGHNVRGSAGRGDGSDGCRFIECLANAPWATLFFHVGLEVASGHVQPHSVAKHMVECLLGRDVLPSFSNGHHQLHFVMQILCQGGVVHLAGFAWGH
jgi:hypothetical protein